MFWKKFYELCSAENLSPNSLAQELDISSGSVTNWKNGGTPNGEMLIKIANRLNCSVDYLLGRTTSPQSSEFYYLLISGRGMSAIKKPLANLVKSHGINLLADQLGIEFTEIKQFLDLEPPYGYKCASMFDKMLTFLDTDLYSLIRESVYNELITDEIYSLITALDDTDKAKLTGRIEQMLEADKYQKPDNSVGQDIVAEVNAALRKDTVINSD